LTQVLAEFSKGRALAVYAIPALLYAILNNLTVLLLLYVTPVEVSTSAPFDIRRAPY
jgi:hypothetical protein